MKCPHCGQSMENKISADTKERALKLYCEGKYSLREISKKLDNAISASTVSRIVKEEVRDSMARKGLECKTETEDS